MITSQEQQTNDEHERLVEEFTPNIADTATAVYVSETHKLLMNELAKLQNAIMQGGTR